MTAMHPRTTSCAVALGAMLLAESAMAATVDSCKEIRPASASTQNMSIQASGCYRLAERFDQHAIYSFALGGRMGSSGRAVIIANAPDVELDLAGLSLSSNTGMSGVLSPHVKRGAEHRLVVENGSIELSDSDGNRSGPAVIAPEYEVQRVHALRNYSAVPSTFEHVDYRLENLHLHVGGIGVLLMGDGIVIRNCTIEVEGENAIVIYGPHALIENNRIVYRHNNANPTLITATYPSAPGHYPQVPAAIYLRAADDAVVRGNTIEVKGQVAAAGIALVDSKNAHMEGNRFGGTDEPLRLVGTSAQVSFTDNVSLGGLLRADKKLPDVVSDVAATAPIAAPAASR